MKPTTEDLESVGVSAEVVSVTVVPMAKWSAIDVHVHGGT